MANMNHGCGFFEYVQKDGTVVRGFSCHCDPDEAAARMALDQMDQLERIEDCRAAERARIKALDRMDETLRRGRKIRSEFRHLGRSVNRVPSNVRHW